MESAFIKPSLMQKTQAIRDQLHGGLDWVIWMGTGRARRGGTTIGDEALEGVEAVSMHSIELIVPCNQGRARPSFMQSLAPLLLENPDDVEDGR